MKSLSKIKLNQFSKNEMDKRKLNALKGGICGCTCACGGGDENVDKITTEKYNNTFYAY